MLKTITTLALAATIAIGAATADAKPRCQEDMRCWTWSTMGGLDRGVHLIDDAPRIGARIPGRDSNWRRVDPCEFAFLSHWGGLARDTPRLRGDRFARRHGCDPRFYG